MNNKDIQLSQFICLYLLLNSVNSLLQLGFGLSGSRLSVFKVIVQVVLGLLLIRALHHMKMSKVKYFLYAEFFGVAAIVYSLAFGATNINAVLNYGSSLLFICIPLGVSAFLIYDKSVLFKQLFYYSWAILFTLLTEFFTSYNVNEYDMHFSYSILLIILVHLCEARHKRKKWLYIVCAFEIALLFINGSRGALVCILFFFILRILMTHSKSRRETQNKVIKVAFLVLASGLFYVYYERIINWVFSVIVYLGYNSRTLRLLTQGDFLSHDSGRNEIWAVSIELIKQRPVLGWGLGGANRVIGTYPHQLFLDLWLSFGLLYGSLVIILLISILIISLVQDKGYTNNLLAIGVSISLCLMFSSTVFTNYYFAITLGLALSVLNKNRAALMRRGD